MKLFKIDDFREAYANGERYHGCTMANGFEVRIFCGLGWGWRLDVCNIHGRVIKTANQPYMILLSGGINYKLSHELMLMEVSKLYESSLCYKQIIVQMY